jgi:putative SOS response-associated peptidase YedK
MPVILTNPDDVQRWLTVETAELPSLQRPLPDGTLQVIDPED